MKALFIFLFLCAFEAHSACSSPTGPAGGINYNSTTKKLTFCNGTSWQVFASAGVAGVPAATVVPMTKGACPTGYLSADGSAVSRTTYAGLFAAIGVMYGNGDGSTTFNLPDYRGRFLRGVDGGAGTDPGAGSRTNRGDGTTGDNVGTLQASGYSSHSHGAGTLSGTANAAGGHSHTMGLHQNQTRASGGGGNRVQGGGSTINGWTNTTGNHSHTFSLSGGSTSSNGANESRPKNTYVYYCIRS